MNIEEIELTQPSGRKLAKGILITDDPNTKKFQFANPIMGGRSYNMQDFHGHGPLITIHANGTGEVESRTHSDNGGQKFHFCLYLVNSATEVIASAPLSVFGQTLVWDFDLPDNGSWAYWTPTFPFPQQVFSQVKDVFIRHFI